LPESLKKKKALLMARLQFFVAGFNPNTNVYLPARIPVLPERINGFGRKWIASTTTKYQFNCRKNNNKNFLFARPAP
jgi:hypothetical protein